MHNTALYCFDELLVQGKSQLNQGASSQWTGKQNDNVEIQLPDKFFSLTSEAEVYAVHWYWQNNCTLTAQLMLKYFAWRKTVVSVSQT